MINIDTLCMGCMNDVGEQGVCPDCDIGSHKQRNTVALPLKTILNDRFLVGHVLGNPGGFGITYLVWDMVLDTTAAIKEFLPLSSVSRDPNNSTVRPNSKQDQDYFNQGLQIFLKEAKTLAQFSHPNIVRIRDCFTSNNTAYLVMDYHLGQPLDQVIKTAGGQLTEDKALEIILPILDGLEAVHQKNFLHRDIKPQNIYLTEQGTPLLLDFGASRFSALDSTKTLTVMLSAGYAPFEQYHKKGNQGPWSDIYSIGATLYFMVTGCMPTNAIERQHDNKIVPPIKHNPQLSEAFSLAIMKALSIDPQSRPQNIAALKQLLMGHSFQQAPLKQTVTASSPPPVLAVKKVERKASVIHYGEKPGLNLGRLFLYSCLVVAIWSGWSNQQVLDDNNLQRVKRVQEIGSDLIDEEITDEYVEMEDPFPIETINPPPSITAKQFSTPPTQENQAVLMEKPLQREHPAIPEMAFTSCQYKRPHNACQYNSINGKQRGQCLPVPAGKLACLSRQQPPPAHFRPKFQR